MISSRCACLFVVRSLLPFLILLSSAIVIVILTRVTYLTERKKLLLTFKTTSVDTTLDPLAAMDPRYPMGAHNAIMPAQPQLSTSQKQRDSEELRRLTLELQALQTAHKKLHDKYSLMLSPSGKTHQHTSSSPSFRAPYQRKSSSASSGPSPVAVMGAPTAPQSAIPAELRCLQKEVSELRARNKQICSDHNRRGQTISQLQEFNRGLKFLNSQMMIRLDPEAKLSGRGTPDKNMKWNHKDAAAAPDRGAWLQAWDNMVGRVPSVQADHSRVRQNASVSRPATLGKKSQVEISATGSISINGHDVNKMFIELEECRSVMKRKDGTITQLGQELAKSKAASTITAENFEQKEQESKLRTVESIVDDFTQKRVRFSCHPNNPGY